MGIEPTLEAWEASVLPLNYTRVAPILTVSGSGTERRHLASQPAGCRCSPDSTHVARLDKSLDFDVELGAADIGVQEGGGMVSREALAQGILHQLQIGGMAKVDLHGGDRFQTRRGRVPAGQQSFETFQSFAELGAGLAVSTGVAGAAGRYGK